MKIMVTGGFGFLGSNFIHYWLERHPGDTIVNLDCRTSAANLRNVAILENDERYTAVDVDITNLEALQNSVEDHAPNLILNFAAESHNSAAILSPARTFAANAGGVVNLLECLRSNPRLRLHHVSTCEVFGDLDFDSHDTFTERSAFVPTSPYSGSKACANLMIRCYVRTFAVNASISHTCNNYGPYQRPEKVIPKFITSALENQPITLYEESHHRREWLHVIDHCRALEMIICHGEPGQEYNVGSGSEIAVGELAELIVKLTNADPASIKKVKSRPSHDRRYLLDSSKICQDLGWKPSIGFADGLKQTVEWYSQNPEIWQPCLQEQRVDESHWESRRA